MLRFCGEFGFEAALVGLKHGGKIRNAGWNGKGMYLEVQYPDKHSANTEPYIFLVTGDKRVPWTPSQLDIFSKKWQVGEETVSYGEAMEAVENGKWAFRTGWPENEKKIEMYVAKKNDGYYLMKFGLSGSATIVKYLYRYSDSVANDWVISDPF